MQKGEKFTIIIGVIVYLILLGVFVKMFRDDSAGTQLKILVPWGFIGIFMSFYIYREYNRVNKAKRKNRQEELNARRQELLDNVLRKNKEINKPNE
ncbi:MAG TPA: FeoB-associated Cys-rich membrane protein [Chitinophagaceae bacterium]|nr:FeoB-associated Cys-rich membrane protein [Chitinophagaceae bacterium]